MRHDPRIEAVTTRAARFAVLVLGFLCVPWSDASAQIAAQRSGPHQRAMPRRAPRPGHEIFRANCASCHGPQGLGGTSWVVPTQAGPAIAGRPPLWTESNVRNGHLPQMPAFPVQEMSDYELADLAAYVNALPASFVPDPAAQVTVTVTDEDPWFNPMQVSIQPGDTVRFVNVGRTWHPVVETTWLMTHGHDGTNSGQLGPGASYYRRFEHPGTHVFLCGMHPYMRGEVHVGSGFTPPNPAPSAPRSLPPVPGVGEIWVSAQFQDWPGRATDGVVQVIDAASWTVTHAIPAGNNPHNLWFGAASNQVALTNWFDTTVSRIDANTKSLLGGDCIAGAGPAHVTSDYAGQYWFVTLEGDQHVRAFTQTRGPDALCGNTLSPQHARLSGYGPHGIWYGGGKLVTTNSLDSTFSILDAATLTELALLPAGMHPLGASTNVAGTLAAAGSLLEQCVTFYDLVGMQRIRDIPVAHGAVQVPFTPDGRLVFAANGSQVTVIDVAKAVDAAGTPLPGAAILANIPTGRGAHGVAFGNKSGGGLYAYVTHKFENYVTVIDVGTMQVVGDVPLALTTTGKVSLAGITDTGGNGIATRPNPSPWQ